MPRGTSSRRRVHTLVIECHPRFDYHNKIEVVMERFARVWLSASMLMLARVRSKAVELTVGLRQS